ncbi:MAG: hypothetical protein ACF8PN_05345 [Phycisphaerales bacterium]
MVLVLLLAMVGLILAAAAAAASAAVGVVRVRVRFVVVEFGRPGAMAAGVVGAEAAGRGEVPFILAVNAARAAVETGIGGLISNGSRAGSVRYQ